MTGRRAALALLFLAAGLSAWAAEVTRNIQIDAPATAVAGKTVKITISASTEARGDEQIGFLQAESSTDGGKTWEGVCYDTKAGISAVRDAYPKAGKAGSVILLRVRVAFRSSQGDVDFTGKPIDWNGTWQNWKTPPTKISRTVVVAR